MIYRPYTTAPAHLKCYNNKKVCGNKSSRFEYVERHLIIALTDWLESYKAEWIKYKQSHDLNDKANEYELNAIKNLNKEIELLYKQKSKLHDLFERELYDEETFLLRSKEIAERIDEHEKAIQKLEETLKYSTKNLQSKEDLIPKLENALKFYKDTDKASEKNDLLKSVLQYAVYMKEPHQRNDEFTLKIYPRID